MESDQQTVTTTDYTDDDLEETVTKKVKKNPREHNDRYDIEVLKDFFNGRLSDNDIRQLNGEKLLETLMISINKDERYSSGDIEYFDLLSGLEADGILTLNVEHRVINLDNGGYMHCDAITGYRYVDMYAGSRALYDFLTRYYIGCKANANIDSSGDSYWM